MDATTTATTTVSGRAAMAAPMNWWRRLSHNCWLVRLFKALLTVYSVTAITFFRVRLLPGNPAGVYIQSLVQQYGLSYREARNRASILFAINLTQPLGLQYVDYLGNRVHGHLGTSITAAGTPVVTEIGEYLPWTLFSVGVGLLASFVLGVLPELVMAYRHETWLDHVLSTVVLFIILQKWFMKGITEGALRQ